MKFALLMQRWPPHRRHPLIYPRDRPRHWMSGILVARSPAQKSFGETFGEAFGAATGVSDPRLQKNRIRNHHLGGDAATVAGYAGPGFHIWPTGHIPQNTDRIRFHVSGHLLKNRSARRSAPRPGSATHGYRGTESETTIQAATPPL
jgi:hypothetical protein